MTEKNESINKINGNNKITKSCAKDKKKNHYDQTHTDIKELACIIYMNYIYLNGGQQGKMV